MHKTTGWICFSVSDIFSQKYSSWFHWLMSSSYFKALTRNLPQHAFSAFSETWMSWIYLNLPDCQEILHSLFACHFSLAFPTKLPVLGEAQPVFVLLQFWKSPKLPLCPKSQHTTRRKIIEACVHVQYMKCAPWEQCHPVSV